MRIDLGSGYRHPEGFICIDNRIECNPDILCDITEGLPFQNDSIEYVRAHDFLEHIPINKMIFVIEEIYRVLKHQGTFDVFVPSTDGRGAWQDPTHVSFWNVNSFFYYQRDEYRALYGIKAKFIGTVRNLLTDPINKIVHCQGLLFAVK